MSSVVFSLPSPGLPSSALSCHTRCILVLDEQNVVLLKRGSAWPQAMIAPPPASAVPFEFREMFQTDRFEVSGIVSAC